MSYTLIDPIKHFTNSGISNDFPSFLFTGENDFFASGADVFRSYYSSVFHFRTGSARFEVGSRVYDIEAGSIATVGQGLPYRWLDRKDLTFDAIIFSDDVFVKGFDKSVFCMLDYFCPDAYNIINIGRGQYEEVSMLIDTLKALRSNQASIPGILHALLMLLQEHYSRLAGKNNKPASGREVVVTTFRALLAEHFTDHKNVSFYASEMNISAKYLSEILLKETGWTAKKWIDHHLVIEAKSMLSYSKLPIKEVAYQLGFQDVSHFTKAFKKWTQLTPGEFSF